MVTRDGRRFVLGTAGVAAVLAAAGAVHAQDVAVGAALRPHAVDDSERGDKERRLTGRLLVHVNGAYQPTVRRYGRATLFEAYGEQARFLSREEFEGQTHVDAGGAVRVWRRMEIGASYTQVSRSGTAVVTGTVPHPLETDMDRTAPAQTVTLPHRQRATHVYASWRFRLRDSVSMALSAGPTYFNLRQGSSPT